MMRKDDLKSSIKVCMFDQYGTIVDMQAGLTEVARPYLAAKGWKGDPSSFVTWWRRTHFENSMIDALLGRAHTPYPEIGHRSVALVLERAGISYNTDEVRHLVGEIEKLRPFPEVPPALERLRARYQLAVLSNGDPDMLEAAKPPSRHCVRPGDLGRGRECLQAARGDYAKAAEIMGTRMDQILFVANHAFDCIGAKSAGMCSAFINRRRRPFGVTPHAPDLVVGDMGELADIMT
jgi:2-haloacid dehalogenase